MNKNAINATKITLWYLDNNTIILQISSRIPNFIEQILNGKYYLKKNSKPGSTIIKFNSYNHEGVEALFNWFAKQEIKWKCMVPTSIFNSKKYNKRNVAHLKFGLNAVLEYAKVPKFDAAVQGGKCSHKFLFPPVWTAEPRSVANIQAPKPGDAVISPNCGASKLAL
ncbi:hypothetical protein CAL7716_102550 (plasmid) [Calothrix sp. PCC 7716]|nr:hypothetical protein CAL7716_102550 [Calothrix sp. PCC 7716]